MISSEIQQYLVSLTDKRLIDDTKKAVSNLEKEMHSGKGITIRLINYEAEVDLLFRELAKRNLTLN